MSTRAAARRLGTAAAAAAGVAVGAALVGAARPRAPLPDARAPVPPPLPPARLVPVPDRGELFFREVDGPGDASAPTILLLHGWMFPADLNWFTCYEPLGEDGRVIALDHRGHGRGLRPSSPFRLADAADDAAALVRHLGAAPVIAVGYSMGGPVAQLLWRRHPAVVRGLVLCATSATFSARPRDRWVWRTMGAVQLLLRLLPRSAWERAVLRQASGELPIPISRMIHPDTPEEVRQLLPWIMSELVRGNAEDIAEAGRELGRYDSRSWISAVDVPTSVIVTGRDQLVPPANQHDLASRIPDAFVQELPVDHDGIGARPDLFVPALRKAVAHIVDVSS